MGLWHWSQLDWKRALPVSVCAMAGLVSNKARIKKTSSRWLFRRRRWQYILPLIMEKSCHWVPGIRLRQHLPDGGDAVEVLQSPVLDLFQQRHQGPALFRKRIFHTLVFPVE